MGTSTIALAFDGPCGGIRHIADYRALKSRVALTPMPSNYLQEMPSRIAGAPPARVPDKLRLVVNGVIVNVGESVKQLADHNIVLRSFEVK